MGAGGTAFRGARIRSPQALIFITGQSVTPSLLAVSSASNPPKGEEETEAAGRMEGIPQQGLASVASHTLTVTSLQVR